ncbi:MAG: bifunctional folylpolyglutamate synthase/dihydrofolate synthase, partial [Clostridia bacterium]|nr:bifunctional folylpolyglutamate synthase/dihydrofolate synthase [Clostridia bacterium]
ETAKRKKSPLLLASQLISAKFSAGSSQDSSSRNLIISKEGETLFDNIASPLTGSYQEKNIATYTAAALELCRIMGFSADKIKDGIENVQKNFVLNGRWQIVDKSPLTICDTGHNPGCLTETMAQIKSLTYQTLHFVIGFVNDKDIETIFTLLPREAQYYACAASVERAFPASELTKKMSEAGFKTEQCSTVTEAYSKAKANAKNEDVIFVGGSTFVVADFIKGEKAHFSLS